MVLYFSILSKYGQLSTSFVSNLLVPVKPKPELKHGMRLKEQEFKDLVHFSQK